MPGETSVETRAMYDNTRRKAYPAFKTKQSNPLRKAHPKPEFCATKKEALDAAEVWILMLAAKTGFADEPKIAVRFHAGGWRSRVPIRRSRQVCDRSQCRRWNGRLARKPVCRGIADKQLSATSYRHAFEQAPDHHGAGSNDALVATFPICSDAHQFDG